MTTINNFDAHTKHRKLDMGYCPDPTQPYTNNF